MEVMIKSCEEDRGLVAESFSKEEVDDLSRFATNSDSNIFAWKIGDLLTAEQAGALLSRYSRTSLTGRRLFLKEFLPNRERGREFFESWLVDYGDDSIQEMAGGIPVSCEFVSNLAVKDIEDSRLASYIEKSSRYVSFDKKLPGGTYMYYKGRDISESKFAERYEALMDGLFDSYSSGMKKMVKYIEDSNRLEDQVFRVHGETLHITEMDSAKEERYGIGEEDLRRAYDNAVKANALDFMRDYLPMATLTHVGISANARSYENLVTKMLASPLGESRWIGGRILSELGKLVPSLMKRAAGEYGESKINFIRASREGTERAVADALPNAAGKGNVSLVDYTGRGVEVPDDAAQVNLCAAIVYRFSEGISFGGALEYAREAGRAKRDSIICAYVGKRENRRLKPGRAFEHIEYLAEFTGRLGIYRDLQRHRIGTQERQRLTTKMGFEMRPQFEEIGISDDYKSRMALADELYREMQKEMPYHAQYVVTYGFLTRWYYRMNARQLFHFIELRTTSGGHPDYRMMAQQLFRAVEAVHPSVTKHMGFVNLEDKKLGRLDSEIRIAIKRRRI